MDDEPMWAADHVVAPTPGSAITILETANEFAIKGNHLTLVKGYQFDGRTKTDPHKHIHEFLRICDMFKYKDTKNKADNLMMFPLSLTGEAKTCRFFPPALFDRHLEEIRAFSQHENESLTDAWLRMKEMLRNCHGHNLSKGNIIKIFYHGLSEITQEVLNAAAGGSSNSDTNKIMTRMDAMTLKMDAQYKELQLNAKKAKSNLDEDDIPMSHEEEAKFMQTFRKTRFYNDYRDRDSNRDNWRLSGRNDYNRDNYRSNINDKPYDLQKQFNDFMKSQQSTNAFVKETFMDLKTQLETIAKNHQASIQNLETKFDKLVDKQSGRPSGSLPSNTQPNLKGQNSKAYQPPQSHNSETPVNFDSDDEDDEPTPKPKIQNPKQAKETPLPKPYKPKISYPQRLRKEKMEAQYGKFLDMIRAVQINVPLIDVLAGMPNYGKFLKELISNKHKIELIFAAFLSDESSAMIQNKVPPKLRDPESFLIPCNFNKTFSCNALADLAKNMLVEVGKFTFPADFVILEMEEDSKVSLILGRPFLHTANAVIRVKQKQLNLVVGTERMIFNIDSAIKHSYSKDDTRFNYKIKTSLEEPPTDLELNPLPDNLEYVFLEEPSFLPVIISSQLSKENKNKLVSVLKKHKEAFSWKTIDIPGICPSFCKHKIQLLDDKKPVVQKQRRLNPNMQEVIKKEIVKLLDTGIIYPITDSPWVSPIHYVPKKGGITVVTNENDELVPTRTVTGWRVCIDYRKLNEATVKDHFPLPFMDQMLERLAGNKYFCFLDGFSGYFQIPIDLNDQEKTTFTCPFGTHAYRRMPFGLCNTPITFQRCMLAIFHDMIEESVEVFMDDFSVFRNSFDKCLNNLDKMLQCCEDAHLVLNWEKCHFMVKEGIMLGHKVSSAGLEVDKAKINVISKHLPHNNIKGVRNFLGHADFYRCFIKDFSKIARPIIKLLESDTPFEFDDECLKAFELLKEKLTCAPVIDRKGTENVAADHLSRIENDESSDDSEVDDNFPGETLMKINTKDEPCGQVENKNKALKRILEKTVKDNLAIWSRKLDDALWAFRTAYKTPTRTTPYKLIYGKNCHLPFEIEHRAYWTLKNCNPYLIATGEKRMFQLHELDELRNQAYENSLLYKARIKV
ncbi:reverse transcriptase domain-containing protein [Tanacetum coccineum]